MARFAFVQNLAVEYLGTLIVATVLKRDGHDVRFFIDNGRADALHDILAYEPDVLAAGVTTGAHEWALDLFARTKDVRPETMTLMGGAHPTFFPEVLNETPLDAIALGETEFAARELARRLDAGRDYLDLAGFHFKRNGRIQRNPLAPLPQNLDDAPAPDRDLYYARYPVMDRTRKNFMATRGCPFDCTFCFNHALKMMYRGHGPYVRRRSVENVLLEIEQVRSRWDLRTVYFQDDTFVLDRGWLREFLTQYARRVGIRYSCLLRADQVDPELAALLADTGCFTVYFGIETGNERYRNEVLKKRLSNAQIERAADLLHKVGIPFLTYNILALPGETVTQAFETVALNTRIKTDYPWVSLFQPYPRTELGDRALGDDRDDITFHPSFFRAAPCAGDDERELSNLHKLFWWAVKFPRLRPVIERWIKGRPNIVFDAAFLAGYAHNYYRGEKITLRELVAYAWLSLRRFYFA